MGVKKLVGKLRRALIEISARNAPVESELTLLFKLGVKLLNNGVSLIPAAMKNFHNISNGVVCGVDRFSQGESSLSKVVA